MMFSYITLRANFVKIDCCNNFRHWDIRESHILILWHMVRFYNKRGMSSLLSNDSVNFLAATNAGNSSEYIVITRY
jgi:hypothetical protein